jgi:hypothetical protein
MQPRCQSVWQRGGESRSPLQLRGRQLMKFAKVAPVLRIALHGSRHCPLPALLDDVARHVVERVHGGAPMPQHVRDDVGAGQTEPDRGSAQPAAVGGEAEREELAALRGALLERAGHEVEVIAVGEVATEGIGVVARYFSSRYLSRVGSRSARS